MKIKLGGRGSGKTTEMIKLAHETDSLIICHNEAAARYAKGLAKSLEIDIIPPISLTKILHGSMKGSSVRKVIIDNAELCLKSLFVGVEIKGISMTEEDNK